MTISAIANLISLPIAITCGIISIRAFYVYALSRNSILFILGFSMALISLGTFVGNVGEAHLGGNTFNAEWARAFGACTGALFIFLSSLINSHTQLQRLRRWQIATFVLFVIVVLLTPLYPPFSSPYIPILLYSCRIVIYGCAFIRYMSLYMAKSTHFSLILSIGFLVLVVGYIFNLPGILYSGLALVTIVGAIIRMVGFVTLFVAYSAG